MWCACLLLSIHSSIQLYVSLCVWCWSVCVYVRRILIVWLKCVPSSLCGVPVYYWVFILLPICMSLCVYDVDLSVCRARRLFIVWLKCGHSAFCGVPVYHWVFILPSNCMSVYVYDVDLSVCRVRRIFIVWLKCGPSSLCGVPVYYWVIILLSICMSVCVWCVTFSLSICCVSCRYLSSVNYISRRTLRRLTASSVVERFFVVWQLHQL